MSKTDKKTEVMTGDVLVVGAGPAGCTAALKAKEKGLEVILLDKVDPEWSGSAGRGIDQIHGLSTLKTAKDAIEITQRSYKQYYDEPHLANENMIYRLWEKEAWALAELERYVPLKWYDGDYLWFKMSGPYAGATLRFPGLAIKPALADALRKAKIRVLAHNMLADVLTSDGRVAGATAVSTRTGEFTQIRARAVVIATGSACRHYDPELPTSKYKYKYHHCPSALSGDGVAAAYRAGAELVNMEMTEGSVPHTDYCTITRGCLIAVRPMQRKEYTWDGEEMLSSLSGTTKKVFAELERQGKTPLYRTFEHLPDLLQKRLEVNYIDEGFVNLKLAQDRGFNPRTHYYDVSRDKPYPVDSSAVQMPSLVIDEDFMTTIPGLYGIGDAASCVGAVMSAIVSGFYVGDTVGDFITGLPEPSVDEAQAEELKEAAITPLGVRGDGQEPIEFECSVRQICERYIGIFKSEGKLREGIRRLDSLKRNFLPKLKATNPHYLMRCLEARNIIDIAQLHIHACLAREETRGLFNRVDHPEKDPARDGKLTYQRLKDGELAIELREAPRLKPEFGGDGN